MLGAIPVDARQVCGMVSGKVLSPDGIPIDYATVYLKGTNFYGAANEKGIYHIKAPAGRYTIVFSSVGFEPKELTVLINEGERTKLNVKLRQTAELAEVVIVGNYYCPLNHKIVSPTS